MADIRPLGIEEVDTLLREFHKAVKDVTNGNGKRCVDEIAKEMTPDASVASIDDGGVKKKRNAKVLN